MAAGFLTLVRNRAEHLLDPLATGAVLFNRPDWKTAAAGDERKRFGYWVFGAWLRLIRWLKSRIRLDPWRSQKAAYIPMADPAPAKAQLVIDAGPQGSLSGGHGHADAERSLSAEGRELLLDPGTYCYVSADNSRTNSEGQRHTIRYGSQNQIRPRLKARSPGKHSLTPRWNPG